MTQQQRPFDATQPHTIAEWRVSPQFSETQEEFAERLGVSVATLRSWESERKSPRLRTRRAVAQKLGIPLSLILFPEARPHPKEMPTAA